MKTKLKQYNVFFVDDEPEMHTVIADELEGIGCKVTCFASAADCLEQLGKQNCNLLITDVNMPDMDGLALLNKVRHIAPWVPVMIITGYGDVPMSVKALKSGAVDFIEKPLDRKSFLHKVETILKTDDFVDTPVGRTLTKTEKKVLKLILEGRGNKEIAYKLGRALRTVELHRSHIMHKFGVDSVVNLVKKTALMDFDSVE